MSNGIIISKREQAMPEIIEGKLGNNNKLFIHSDLRPFSQLGIVKGLDCVFLRCIP